MLPCSDALFGKNEHEGSSRNCHCFLEVGRPSLCFCYLDEQSVPGLLKTMHSKLHYSLQEPRTCLYIKELAYFCLFARSADSLFLNPFWKKQQQNNGAPWLPIGLRIAYAIIAIVAVTNECRLWKYDKRTKESTTNITNKLVTVS